MRHCMTFLPSLLFDADALRIRHANGEAHRLVCNPCTELSFAVKKEHTTPHLCRAEVFKSVFGDFVKAGCRLVSRLQIICCVMAGYMGYLLAYYPG